MCHSASTFVIFAHLLRMLEENLFSWKVEMTRTEGNVTLCCLLLGQRNRLYIKCSYFVINSYIAISRINFWPHYRIQPIL